MALSDLIVKLSLDQSKFERGINGANSSLERLEKKFTSSRTGMVDWGKVQDSLKDKSDKLSDKVQLQEARLEKLRQKYDAASNAEEKDEETLKRLAVQIGAAEGKLKDLQEQLESNNQQLDDASSKWNQLSTDLQGIGGKLQETGQAVTEVGKNLSTKVTAPLVAVGTATGKMAMGFEDSMAKVSTIADTTEVPLSELESAIMELSNQSGISASEIAQNVYDAISAGQSTGDAVNFVTNSTQLAKAGFAEAGAALDILTTILNAYGLEASEVTNVSDMLVQTQNLGKTTVGELSSQMGKVIPTAKGVSVGLDQVCTGYAVMTANGIATAESTTYMNSMLNELGDSGSDVAGILKEKTGMSFAQLMQNGYSLADTFEILRGAADEQGISFQELWSSSEGAKAAVTILGDSAESFNSTLAEMRDSTGATADAFEKVDSTSSQKLEKSFNRLKNTGTEFGTVLLEQLAPAFDTISNAIEKLQTWFSGLSEGQQQMIVKIGLVVAAIGPVLMIVGQVISVIGTITGAIGTVMGVIGPIGGVLGSVGGAIGALLGPLAAPIAIMAAVGVGVVALIKHWDDIKAAAGRLKEAVAEKWEGLKNAVSEKCESLKNAVSEKWEGIKSAVSEKAGAIKEAASEKFAEISSNIGDALQAQKEGTEQTLANMKDAYESNGGGIKGIASATMEGVKGYFTTGYNTLNSLTGGKLGEIAGAFKSKLSPITNKVSEIFGSIKDKIKEKVDAARDTVHDVIEAIKNKFNFNWSLPKLKLPHPRITGEFSLNPPSVPHFSIDWYAKAMRSGMILNQPTIFGFNSRTGNFMGGGEAGSETVVGTNSLMSMIRSAANDGGSTDYLLKQIIALMSEFFPTVLGKMDLQIVLDDGTLVGRLSPKIDRRLAMAAAHAGRGN